jgi:hypothetical protein
MCFRELKSLTVVLHKDTNPELTGHYFATCLVVIPRVDKTLWSK